MATTTHDKRIPRDSDSDYTREAADARRRFLKDQTGGDHEHVASYSFDPSILPGNVESFVGVAQVPLGVAGPLLVDGEHARGEFFVPLATAEGTLVARYNRGMKRLREAGGVKVTVMDDVMQRAPAFLFDSECARIAGVRAVAGRLTIPSLIVATHRGGTHLATQRECLEMLGCYGKGKVRKLPEVVAATVLCGELSLGSAIVADEWVHAHDLYGRNR